VESEVQVSTSPSSNCPEDGVIVTSGGQSTHKSAVVTAGSLATN